MSTLSLADLGPKMRRELGLETSCECAGLNVRPIAADGMTAVTTVAVTIPVIETRGPARQITMNDEQPGAAWLKTGLHRLRLPASSSSRVHRPTSLPAVTDG